jgi:hypothetical protein
MRRHLIALRWLPFAVLSAIFGLIAPLMWTDWSVAQAAGKQLLSPDALTVFADHPQAQMGPLALLAAGALPQPAYIIVTSLMLTVFLYICEKSVPVGHRGSPQRVLFCVGVGGACLVYPWSDLASQGHLDDMLVLIGAALMLRAVLMHSPVQAGLAFGLAMAGKPTAVLFAPILLPAGMTAIAVAATATAILWLPFFLADPGGFLAAGKGVVEVRPGSFPSYLGYELWGPTPSWIRLLALGGGALVCLAFVRRGDLIRGMLAAFALRTIVDPNPASCYATTLIALGLLADVPYRRVPWTALTGMLGWIVAGPVVIAPVFGWPRILATAAIAAVSPRVSKPPVAIPFEGIPDARHAPWGQPVG